tara:strand:- start:3980 stop:4378 length:399 start_codon:yes stop_codon:yes gene_type:complete
MVEDYKTIDLEQISVKLHRRIYKKFPDMSVTDLQKILYTHFALIKSVMTAPNFRLIRIQYLGSFQVFSNVFFMFGVGKYKQLKKGKITKDEYDKQIEEYLPHFEELKGYKNSKSFKFDKKDWEKYVDDKEKS